MKVVSGKFTEIFRPKNIKDIILPQRVSKIFNNDKQLQQSYLFYSGVPGSGKTTLCKALANGYDALYINCSDESSVETIRVKIKDFIISSSLLDGKYQKKVIILDEIDGASVQFEKALRGVMEDREIGGADVIYLATCNYINQVSEPVQSRFECIEFEPQNEEEVSEVKAGLQNRIAKILKHLEMTIDLDALEFLVTKSFPDMRKMLNTLQRLYIMGKDEIHLEDVANLTYEFVDVYKLAVSKPNPEEVYKLIMGSYMGKADLLIQALGSDFVGWIKETKPNSFLKVVEVFDVVNNASYKRKFVIDPMVNLLDCIFKIQKIFNN